MQRSYLQDPLTVESLNQIKAWHQRLDTRLPGSDSVWVVIDGALVGIADIQRLQTVYGSPTRAFDETSLAAYEELGLLLWSWQAMDAKDGLETMLTVIGDRPGISFVRIRAGRSDALGAMLAWLATAATADDMPFYMRVGDSRVLASFLRHMQPAQQARLQAVIREWVWPDRAGHAQSKVIELAATLITEPASSLVLDDTQFTAMLDDAEADILHATFHSMESTWRDERSGAQLHDWLQCVLQRMAVLGITRHHDRMAFTSLALRVSGNFESAIELGETWLRVRSGAAELADEVEHWNSSQWAAVERFWHK